MLHNAFLFLSLWICGCLAYYDPDKHTYTPSKKFYDDNYDTPYNYYNNYYDDDYTGKAPTNSYHDMRRSQKSYSGTYGNARKTDRVYVPVVIKKKTSKKRKIISSHKGFYIPGGTQMFGKFKDLFSCQKACEITPTCFSGDFNPWLGKCYLHSNITACGNMRTHSAVTHFKKVPCSVLETTRGYVVLGVNTINGIEIKGIKSLSDCIKKCATIGGGVATKDSNIVSEGQICCNLDYDFATHKCYFHPCISTAHAQANICSKAATVNNPPLNSIANPTTVSVTICPLSEAR